MKKPLNPELVHRVHQLLRKRVPGFGLRQAVKISRLLTERVSSAKADETLKFDQGKAPISLVPSEFIEGMAEVLAFGAEKYGKHNWTKGTKWSRTLDAALRHLNAFEKGVEADAESGKSHLLHAATNVMFLYIWSLMGRGEDDRWKRPLKE